MNDNKSHETETDKPESYGGRIANAGQYSRFARSKSSYFRAGSCAKTCEGKTRKLPEIIGDNERTQRARIIECRQSKRQRAGYTWKVKGQGGRGTWFAGNLPRARYLASFLSASRPEIKLWIIYLAPITGAERRMGQVFWDNCRFPEFPY
jgi:hypothetical protein